MRLVLQGPPGLESLLNAELAALGLRAPQRYVKSAEAAGPVVLEGTLESLYRANLWLRTAERALVRLGSFRAESFAELERVAARLPWKEVLAAGRPVLPRVECRRSKLYHQKGVGERLARAAGAPLAREEAGAQRLYVSVVDDVCTVDADASGEPLHRRGYRQAAAKAPLRETLAAALLLESGWDLASPLFDPFCGSGTIAIEAALLARGAAPGRKRRFAFMDWPSFDAALWARLLKPADGDAAKALPPIAGSDRDEGAVAAARANAERAGVARDVSFSRAAVSAAQPPSGPGWLVSNPPYGHRVQGGDVRDVYAQLGKLVRERCAGWRVTLLCQSVPLARATGLPLRGGPSTKNGGLDVRLASLGAP